MIKDMKSEKDIQITFSNNVKFYQDRNQLYVGKEEIKRCKIS